MFKRYCLYFGFGVAMLLGLILLHAWVHIWIVSIGWFALGVYGVLYHLRTDPALSHVTAIMYAKSFTAYILGFAIPSIAYITLGILFWSWAWSD